MYVGTCVHAQRVRQYCISLLVNSFEAAAWQGGVGMCSLAALLSSSVIEFGTCDVKNKNMSLEALLWYQGRELGREYELG